MSGLLNHCHIVNVHFPDDTIELAPTYDQVPLRHQGTDGRMALAVNGEYRHAYISLQDIAAELVSWRCSSFSDDVKTVAFIEKCLETYRNSLNTTYPNEKAYPDLHADISSFITNLLSGKAAGSSVKG